MSHPEGSAAEIAVSGAPVAAGEPELGEPGFVDLSITIPAHLEAENLAVLLPQIKAAAAALTPHYEILVADTQTPLDNTAEVCAQHGVRHLPRTGGNSFGDAQRTLIAAARGSFLLNMDADGSHSPAAFASMWAGRDKFDIVIGSRYAEGGHTENPRVLIFMSYVVNVIFRVAFSIDAKDVTTSFRLYRRGVLAPLKLQSNDFDILEEILIKAARHTPPARIGEVPVTFYRRQAGESKRKLLQFALGYAKTLQRLRAFDLAAGKENGRP